jgi:hypothetical protein
MPHLPVPILLGLPWLRSHIREDGWSWSTLRFALTNGTTLPITLERPSTLHINTLTLIRDQSIGEAQTPCVSSGGIPVAAPGDPVRTRRSRLLPVYLRRATRIDADCTQWVFGHLSRADSRVLGALATVDFIHDPVFFSSWELKFADGLTALSSDGRVVLGALWPFSHSLLLPAGLRIGWLSLDTTVVLTDQLESSATVFSIAPDPAVLLFYQTLIKSAPSIYACVFLNYWGQTLPCDL